MEVPQAPARFRGKVPVVFGDEVLQKLKLIKLLINA